MVALTLRARVACIQVKDKGKEYIVEKYLDGFVKSSNYYDVFFFFLNPFIVVSIGASRHKCAYPTVLGTRDYQASVAYVVQKHPTTVHPATPKLKPSDPAQQRKSHLVLWVETTRRWKHKPEYIEPKTPVKA